MNHKSYLKGLGIGIIVTALVLMISGKINNKVSDDYVIKRAKELGMTESTTLTAPLQNNPEVQSAEVADSNNGTSDSDIKNNSKDSNKEISDVKNESDTTDKDNSNASDKENSDVKNNSDTSNSDNSDVKDSSDTSDKDKSEVANNSDDKYNLDNSNDKSTTNNSDNGVSDANDNSNNANSGDKNSDKDIADNNSAEDKDKTENNSENKISDPNVKRVTVEVKGGQSSETVSNAVMNAGLCESETEFNKYLCQNGYDKRLRVGVYNIPVDSDFETISKYLCGMIEE